MSSSDDAKVRSKPVAAIVAGVIVIGIVVTLIVPNVMQKFDQHYPSKPRVDLTVLKLALNEFLLSNDGRYPADLSALWTPDAHGHRYLELTKWPRDPWKNPYVYRPPATPDGRPTLLCVGPDGIEGTDDDIHPDT